MDAAYTSWTKATRGNMLLLTYLTGLFHLLGRSSKTGGSKGYAFVEFKFKGVANVMAETMNNYLMFEKILKCQVIPSERVKKSIFKGKINPKKSPAKMRRFAAKKSINASKTEEQNEKRTKRHANKLQKIKEKLHNFGVVLNVNAK